MWASRSTNACRFIKRRQLLAHIGRGLGMAPFYGWELEITTLQNRTRASLFIVLDIFQEAFIVLGVAILASLLTSPPFLWPSKTFKVVIITMTPLWWYPQPSFCVIYTTVGWHDDNLNVMISLDQSHNCEIDLTDNLEYQDQSLAYLYL